MIPEIQRKIYYYQINPTPSAILVKKAIHFFQKHRLGKELWKPSFLKIKLLNQSWVISLP